MKNWYDISAADALKQLEVNADTGLSEQEADKRRMAHGSNAFAKQEKKSLVREILHQLFDISTIILLLAAGLSFALALREGEGFLEPVVILSIVILNLILAITQEQSAERALDALSDLNSPSCVVLRGGAQREIDTAEVVPGDVIILRLGSVVPADARLLQTTDLQIDESALTGESDAAEKDAAAVLDAGMTLGDQKNMVFSGCLVTTGHGVGVVTATGMGTQMGKIAGYLGNSQKIKTPLQIRLSQVAKTISMIAIVSAALLLALGMLQGESFWSMMMLAATLAVAAVPETLNLIVTLALSQGVKNMVEKNALIRKLSAVETLGNTSVICSDKTGTLTQNKMSVKRLWIPGGEAISAAREFERAHSETLFLYALASEAAVQIAPDGAFSALGSPTEVAIMELLHNKGFSKDELSKRYPKVAEIPFSSSRKMMTSIVGDPAGGFLVITKGALDRLPFTPMSEEEKALVKQTHNGFAGDALRVIALGTKHIDTLPENLEEAESALELRGMIGLIDPPRPESAEAVARAKKAGIRTIMITGDHARTAGAIARDIGILADHEKILTGAQLQDISDEELCADIRRYSVYARVSPEDKIRIVEAWQESGEVVSMTGDGVNDTPALKAADVGVAMGKSGTEVAKSASDMVLTDDNFATIIDAVVEGRNVYSNIRKTVYFLLVCNISEIIIMLVAQLKGWGIPVTPVMLLLVNVLGDGIPGLYLAKERSDPRIMDRGPIRRDEGFLSGGLLRVIIKQTLACAAVVLIGYYVGTFVALRGVAGSQPVGQTLAFLILGWTSVLHIFTVRSTQSVFRRTLRDNWPLVLSAVSMLAIFGILAAVPFIGRIFGLTAISGAHWGLAVGLSVLPTIVAEIGKLIDNYTRAREIRQHRHRVIRHKLHPNEDF